MKHKTLRTLLCVILTVCFCLSAIAPVSAAGLFGGESGIASQWDQWIRSLKDLKDRIIEKNPGTDETPADPMAGTGEEFIRIFHLDCGRKYFTVQQIKDIIDQLAANHYTHIELAFGNDGFRFLLDENTLGDITVEGKTYTAKAINEAIHSANVAYCEYKTGSYELTQSDMDEIITYATQKGIGVIPLLNIPGHTNTLVNAMSTLGVPASAFDSNTNSKGYPTKAFDVDNKATVAFVEAFVAKYVEYFGSKGSAYFNIGADECGYDNFTEERYTKLADMLKTIIGYMKPYKMTPFMFNDGLRTTNALADLLKDQGIVVCFWEMQTSKKYYTATQLDSMGFKVINTHNKWYYVAGNGYATGYDWNNYAYHYDWALNNIKSNTTTDGGSCLYIDGESSNTQTMPVGCMLAYWCDNPKAAYNDTDNAYSNGIYSNVCPRNETTTEVQRVKNLIKALADDNPNHFKAASEPSLPTIDIGGNNTELTVGENVIMSTSDGSLAEWSSSKPEVLTLKDNDAVEKALLSGTSSVTVTAVGAGEAAITAKLENGNTISTATITVKTAGGGTDPEQPTTTKTIDLTIGQTLTDTQNGVSGVEATNVEIKENDTVIATYSAAYKNIEGSTTKKRGDRLTKTGTGVISDGTNYLVIDSNGNISNTTKIEEATEITFTENNNSYSNSYSFESNGYYLTTEWSNSQYQLKAVKQYATWSYYRNGYYQNYPYYLAYDAGDAGWCVEYVTNNAAHPYSVSEETVPATNGTVVTFTGVAAGSATVTIGNVLYTVNVAAEDLSGVTPLPISLWFTNCDIEVVSGDTNYTYGQTSGIFASYGGNSPWQDNTKPYYISIPVDAVNSKEGKNISEILPNTLLRYENSNTYWKAAYTGKVQKELVLWSGAVHTKTGNNIQLISGADYSNSGTEFKYVRYFGGTWAVSADRVNWDPILGGTGSTASSSSCTEQIAVYYMMRSTITEEVTTDVADWGYVKDDKEYATQINSGNYVMLDFAVKYEDGTRNPNTFPQDGKTFVFHCNTGDSSGAVQQDSSGNYYRQLNNFRGVNTSDYEIYKVTVTMTGATASDTLDSTTSYDYVKSTEQIVWAIDEATRTASGLEDYVSISGADSVYSGCTIGGDPYVRGVEVYNKHGALITYYIRAIESDSNLIVHYLDRSAGDKEFYSYNIVVSGNTLFDESFAQVKENSKELTGNKVTNKYNVEQTVSADLSTMPAISAQYRYVDYTCVEVKRSDDGKEVFLYYTFDADAAFVIDFGLPLTIPVREINAELANAQITKATAKGNLYGNVEFDVSQQSLIYTPTKPVDKIDIFKVTLEGTRNGASSSVIYTISIIPATNVYYEETFITNPEDSGWTNASTADSVEQTLEEAGNKQNVYGYDTKVENYYLGNPDGTSVGKGITYSMGNALTTTLSIPAGAKEAITEKPLTFSFKGTGFDLISECSDKTGILLVYIKGTKPNADGKPYQGVFLVDTYFAGDNAPEGGTAIMAKGTTVYQVPVVREFGAFNKKYDDTLTENAGLPYDTYQVSVYAYLNNNAGVFDNNAATVASYSAVSVSDSSIIADALAACNITDIDAGQVKLVYMDENSILNGGTGAVAEQSAVSMASLYTATVDSAEVYVDAFRVYNPLGDTTVQISNEKFNPAEKNEVQTYKDDKESGVKYMSLYDFVVGNLGSYGNEADGTSSSVYVEYDGNKPAEEQIVGKEYKVHGPQNEIYLAKGCGIAFHINELSDGQTIQISAKAVDGLPTFNGSDVTATEMYYDLTSMTNALTGTGTGKDVVIYNNGDGVLAISGLKCSATITITANSSATQAAINTIRYAMSAKDASYAPATFEITAPETARRNRSIGIGVTATATDVDSMKIQVMCDGVVVSEETTLYPYNVKAVEQGKATNYYYSKSYRFTKAGTYVFTATAFDGNDNSYSIEKTVVVK